ncbi:hypothetical protein L2E82_12509 [Cichorium intybus]|uniref:Uncharacterized protein n=1 Tax=Cichorium intybus TaxID=13427 RepID=A0ACB9GGE3_CICIN|nr:hypothetical protein L2E82_12509 [Cichorium intybus]
MILQLAFFFSILIDFYQFYTELIGKVLKEDAETGALTSSASFEDNTECLKVNDELMRRRLSFEPRKEISSKHGIYEGIAIGGDVYPVSTLSDHVLRFKNILQVNYALGALYYMCNASTKEDIFKTKVVDTIKRYASALDVSFSNLAESFLDKHVDKLRKDSLVNCAKTSMPSKLLATNDDFFANLIYTRKLSRLLICVCKTPNTTRPIESISNPKILLPLINHSISFFQFHIPLLIQRERHNRNRASSSGSFVAEAC